MLLSRFAEETDLLDWYFIWFLRLDSFCFYQCVYSLNYGLFLFKELISSSLFRRKLRTLDSICVTVSFGNVCLFRRYCTSMFIVIDASV